MIRSISGNGLRRALGLAILPGMFLAPLPALAGPPVTLGDAQFDAPDPASGWKVTLTKGGMLFQKEFSPDEDNRRKGVAVIQVSGPVSATPDDFDRNYQTVVGGVDGMAEERPMRKSDGVTVNGHRIRSDFRCCVSVKGVSVGQRTVGIGSDTSQMMLAFITLGLRGEAEDAAAADFAALVRSLKLSTDDKGFELIAREGDGGLDGVFTHLDTGLRPNAFGGTDFFSESTVTVFDPSGLYATEIPRGGDIQAHCRAEPTDCGLYALKEGGLLSAPKSIEMRAVADDIGTIESETKPFTQDGDDLVIDEGEYVRLPPFAEGTTFSGTWRYFFASSGSTAVSSASVASERILTLGDDGTFTRTGWSGTTGSNETGNGNVGFTTSAKRPAASGRYEVEGYGITLTGEDGATERLSLFAPDGDSDKLLVIDGSNYLKQD